jgi:hypothetical protein
VKREAVVLLHGMGRSWISMTLLGHRLKRRGYQTHLFGYHPRRPTLDELSRALGASSKRYRPPYHFVGHSGTSSCATGFAKAFARLRT